MKQRIGDFMVGVMVGGLAMWGAIMMGLWAIG